MITDQQENAFKELVKSTGYESAPEGMLSSVLNQLEDEKSISSKPTSVIIPTWVWGMVAALVVTFTAYNFYYDPVFNLGQYPNIDLFQIPQFELQFPKFSLGSLNPMIVLTLCVAIFIQLIFIKNYYEKSL